MDSQPVPAAASSCDIHHLFSIKYSSFNSNDDHRHTQKNGGGEDERTEAYRPPEEERQAGGCLWLPDPVQHGAEARGALLRACRAGAAAGGRAMTVGPVSRGGNGRTRGMQTGVESRTVAVLALAKAASLVRSGSNDAAEKAHHVPTCSTQLA